MSLRLLVAPLFMLIGATPVRAQPAPRGPAVSVAIGLNSPIGDDGVGSPYRVGPSLIVEVGPWPGQRWLTPRLGFAFHATRSGSFGPAVKMGRLEVAAVVGPTGTGLLPYASI